MQELQLLLHFQFFATERKILGLLIVLTTGDRVHDLALEGKIEVLIGLIEVRETLGIPEIQETAGILVI